MIVSGMKISCVPCTIYIHRNFTYFFSFEYSRFGSAMRSSFVLKPIDTLFEWMESRFQYQALSAHLFISVVLLYFGLRIRQRFSSNCVNICQSTHGIWYLNKLSTSVWGRQIWNEICIEWNDMNMKSTVTTVEKMKHKNIFWHSNFTFEHPSLIAITFFAFQFRA